MQKQTNTKSRRETVVPLSTKQFTNIRQREISSMSSIELIEGLVPVMIIAQDGNIFGCAISMEMLIKSVINN